jgi:hypothetical protein
MFNAGSFEGAQSLNNPKSNYQSSNYWSKWGAYDFRFYY